MFCKQCGTANSDTAKFCKSCGSPLIKEEEQPAANAEAVATSPEASATPVTPTATAAPSAPSAAASPAPAPAAVSSPAAPAKESSEQTEEDAVDEIERVSLQDKIFGVFQKLKKEPKAKVEKEPKPKKEKTPKAAKAPKVPKEKKAKAPKVKKEKKEKGPKLPKEKKAKAPKIKKEKAVKAKKERKIKLPVIRISKKKIIIFLILVVVLAAIGFVVLVFLSGGVEPALEKAQGTVEKAQEHIETVKDVVNKDVVFENATLALDVDPKTAEPITPADSYLAGTRDLYATVYVKGVSGATKVSAVWTYLSTNMVFSTTEIEIEEEDQISFKVKVPGGIPRGDYKVELLVEEEILETLTFTVT